MQVTLTDLNICTESCSYWAWTGKQKRMAILYHTAEEIIKPLMFKNPWVLSHLKTQGSSTSSAGDWKLVLEITSQEFQNLYVLFDSPGFSTSSNFIQAWLATSSLEKLNFLPSSVNTLISPLAPPVWSQLSQKCQLQNINCISHTFLRCEIHPCARCHLEL